MANLNQQSNNLNENEKKEVLNQVSDDDIKAAIIKKFKKNQKENVFIESLSKTIIEIKDKSEKC
jgi:hypothetical protein